MNLRLFTIAVLLFSTAVLFSQSLTINGISPGAQINYNEAIDFTVSFDGHTDGLEQGWGEGQENVLVGLRRFNDNGNGIPTTFFTNDNAYVFGRDFQPIFPFSSPFGVSGSIDLIDQFYIDNENPSDTPTPSSSLNSGDFYAIGAFLYNGTTGVFTEGWIPIELVMPEPSTQVYAGTVIDKESSQPLEGVQISVFGDDTSVLTDVSGNFSLTVSIGFTTNVIKAFLSESYDNSYESSEQYIPAQTGIVFELEKNVTSKATWRLEQQVNSGNCDVNIPIDNPEWNLEFEVKDLTGDLAPNESYTRRDPSSVLKVNDKYYVWYSYSLSGGEGKVSPWDLNDLYYATSTDGYNWTEEGVAIARGAEGAYDHRSAFTTEVFYHDNMFYLVYQASDIEANLNSNNTIAMAYSISADGPWTKLADPILYPSGEEGTFDKNAVHDPCIIYFNDKYYMYYKGEGGQEGICSFGTQIWGNSNKQVKWGVAVADNVTGPYTRSKFNPVTNTGHEVCVWNSGEGIGIMLHQDGPEYGTTQYSSDGVNFDIMGKVDFPLKEPWNSTYPEAAGLYRSEVSNDSPVSGVSWGLSHVLNWEGSKGQWMYIRRFDLKESSASIEGLEKLQGVSIYPNPVTDKLSITGLESGEATIYNTTGAKVLSLDIESNGSVIDLSGLANGLYILNFKNGDDTYSIRFIKE